MEARDALRALSCERADSSIADGRRGVYVPGMRG